MNKLGFIIYLVFMVSWFLHLTARIPALGIIRFDLLLVSVLFLLKFLQGSDSVSRTQDACTRKLNLLVLTILLIAPLAEWPGSVLYRGLPNFVKVVVFFYFTIWFVNSQKKLFIFIAIFVGCQTFRFIEPLILHVTQGYWGSKASMANWESMDRLSGAPFDVVNPNGLAFVVITVLPFLICFYRINIYFKIVTFIVIPPALYVLMLTGSRSGGLAVLLMGLILFYLSKKKVLYLIGTVLAFFLIFGLLNEVQLDRYRSVYDSDTKNAVTSEGRFAGWSKDLKVAMRRPLFGHGLGTSLEANANFRNNAQPSHNIFIESLQEIGIVGLLMFLIYMWAVIKSLIKNKAGMDNICANTLMPVKSAFTVLALTTIFFGFASYGLSSYEWYMIGGCTVVINKLISLQTINR